MLASNQTWQIQIYKGSTCYSSKHKDLIHHQCHPQEIQQHLTGNHFCCSNRHKTIAVSFT
jgi:hypothetical protein